ncbi:hypothetical protein C8P63_101111 [Melghirimyces profundicolus]|uniref:Uncharacterized protein n=1 Tax=Melghirimyces profundicolus TaxID=1242148 RepID=A0A2T6C9B6_9BACL|nr:hypothetical protein [Melghirimyces profundicolus]PTX64891.1 hypothetical protein C8P63_101111 [Melghirimyces profundicolus]
MGGDVWTILFTALVGGLTGLLLNEIKEAVQRRGKVAGILLSRRIRSYTWADEGKGALKTASSRSSALVLFIEADIRWFNRSKAAVTLDRILLELEAGSEVQRFTCMIQGNGHSFAAGRIPPGDAVVTRLTARVNRRADTAFFFQRSPVRMQVKAETSREKSWTLSLGNLE